MTNGLLCDIIIKLPQKTAKTHIKKTGQKIFLKKLKKGIDKEEKVWYNRQAHAKRVSDRSLTIEQQKIEVQSKFCKCEYKICQNQRENTTLKKSK